MSVLWHPTRWWDWCMPEDGKKKKKEEIESFLLISSSMNLSQFLN